MATNHPNKCDARQCGEIDQSASQRASVGGVSAAEVANSAKGGEVETGSGVAHENWQLPAVEATLEVSNAFYKCSAQQRGEMQSLNGAATCVARRGDVKAERLAEGVLERLWPIDRCLDWMTPCVAAMTQRVAKVGQAVGAHRRRRTTRRENAATPRNERKRALDLYLRQSGKSVAQLLQVLS